MSPQALAALHARAFTFPRPWSAAEFATILAGPGAVLCADPDGAAFALGRVVADEGELLTICTAPEARRQGRAARLLARLMAQMRARGAARIFLEVASDNAAAIALYRAAGFIESGRRPGYYRAPDGTCRDGCIMVAQLAPMPG